MSTSFEKIFTETTILKSYTIKINEYELLDEDILSFELMFNFDQPFIEGILIIKDSFGIAELDIFDGNTTIELYSNDFFDETFTRKFRITSVSNDEPDDKFKVYTLRIVDELYYKLSNTYLSKGFNTDVITAFSEYLTELKLDDHITDNNMTKDFDTSTNKYSFVVPQDRSVLDFFMYEFNNNGYRIWQDRNSISVKDVKFKDLDYIQSNGEKVNYTNNTANPNYAFKIHDFTIKYNNILASNLSSPVAEHQFFDVNTKLVDDETKNLTDIYDDIKLNDKDYSELQHTTGAKFKVDVDVFLGKQRILLEDAYFHNNTLEIVVPGNFKYNNIGKLANVQFKGNAMMTTQALEGDRFHSGTYFVSKMTDRYIGNKLIQKLVLNRIDLQKPRNI
jgi:hypothetical protein